MKTLTIYILLQALSICVIAQKTYKVEFSHNRVHDVPFKGLQNYEHKAKLFFNDTSMLYYLVPYNKKSDKYAKSDIVGENLIHHGIYYSKNDNALYDEIAWPENTNVLLKREFKDSLNWIFTEQYKSICNYQCKMAYAVSNLDTIMVWYNENLGKNIGPSYFVGLPGIVLEVIDQRYAMHYYAKKVEETSQILVFPKNNNGILTSKAELDHYKQKEGNFFIKKRTNITVKESRTFN
jgi:GLPGLI family protein